MVSALNNILCSDMTSIGFQEPPGRPNIGMVKPQCNLPWNFDHTSLYSGGITVHELQPVHLAVHLYTTSVLHCKMARTAGHYTFTYLHQVNN